MSKLSPGPWGVVMGIDQYADTVFGIEDANGQGLVETDGGVYHLSLEDAQVMAAAPDLLEACKAALPLCVHAQNSMRGEAARIHAAVIINAVETVIRQAEGGGNALNG